MRISNLLIIGIFTASGLVSANVGEDFKSCTAKALEQKEIYPSSIIVDIDTQRSATFDHSSSRHYIEYKMAVKTKSGKNLGNVICTFDSSGAIKTARFLGKQRF
ncbi:MAG: hypothetical protein MK188_11465 [Gammaproteobacteria bacterium]|nr:hypothetical protein [Gammaproteobacteria bacterium]